MTFVADGDWLARRAREMHARADRLRNGEGLSSKQTARRVREVANELEVLAGVIGRMERELAEAKAWRAGFEAAKGAPAKVDGRA